MIENPRTHETVIQREMPFLSELIKSTGAIGPLKPKSTPVAESVVEIIVGQMLSGAAAERIYQRILAKQKARSFHGSWLLSTDDLIECGVSKAKARAIKEFGECYQGDPQRFEAWSNLPSDDFVREVTSFWGLSNWSADILAISHFAQPDIFPKNDTTLNRAMRIANEVYGLTSSAWRIEEVRPYRTYLALYLWRSIDQKFWDSYRTG